MTPWTNLHHAASALFPAWERAFAAVALHHKPSVSKELADRIDAFAKEEAAHANAHEAYNRRNNLLEAQANEFKKTRVIHRHPGMKMWLATMVSIEHLAACMGRMQLHKFAGDTSRDMQLFNWHAQEEIDHKDLAIDIWYELGHSAKDLRKVALHNQIYVMRCIFDAVFAKTNWKLFSNWAEAASLFGPIIKFVLLPMLAIYLPKFHPNWFDDKRMAT